jgi:hypothetical protein
MTTLQYNASTYARPQSARDSSPETNMLSGSQYEKSITSDGWERCIAAMTDYDKQCLKRWRNELSDLLVFVSPFLLYLRHVSAHAS